MHRLYPATATLLRGPALPTKEAKKRGPVDFYFVFAGLGDVENGKGFLELSDLPLRSNDLESLLTYPRDALARHPRQLQFLLRDQFEEAWRTALRHLQGGGKEHQPASPELRRFSLDQRRG